MSTLSKYVSRFFNTSQQVDCKLSDIKNSINFAYANLLDGYFIIPEFDYQYQQLFEDINIISYPLIKRLAEPLNEEINKGFNKAKILSSYYNVEGFLVSINNIYDNNQSILRVFDRVFKHNLYFHKYLNYLNRDNIDAFEGNIIKNSGNLDFYPYIMLKDPYPEINCDFSLEFIYSIPYTYSFIFLFNCFRSAFNPKNDINGVIKRNNFFSNSQIKTYFNNFIDSNIDQISSDFCQFLIKNIYQFNNTSEETINTLKTEIVNNIDFIKNVFSDQLNNIELNNPSFKIINFFYENLLQKHCLKVLNEPNESGYLDDAYHDSFYKMVIDERIFNFAVEYDTDSYSSLGQYYDDEIYLAFKNDLFEKKNLLLSYSYMSGQFHSYPIFFINSHILNFSYLISYFHDINYTSDIKIEKIGESTNIMNKDLITEIVNNNPIRKNNGITNELKFAVFYYVTKAINQFIDSTQFKQDLVDKLLTPLYLNFSNVYKVSDFSVDDLNKILIYFKFMFFYYFIDDNLFYDYLQDLSDLIDGNTDAFDGINTIDTFLNIDEIDNRIKFQTESNFKSMGSTFFDKLYKTMGVVRYGEACLDEFSI